MIYSYNHPVSDGIYFYVRGSGTAAALADFQVVKFSACSASADPNPVASTITVSPTANFEGTFNRYDAEHFHL